MIAKSKTEILVTACAIRDVRNRLADVRKIAFDTESHGPQLVGKKMLNVHRSHLTGYSFCFFDGDTREYRSFYVPVGHLEGENAPYHAAYQLLRYIVSGNFEVWAHNWKHDGHVLAREGLPMPEMARDSMIMMWMLGEPDGGRSPYGLKHLAAKHLGIEMDSFKSLFDQKHICNLKPGEVAEYAATDAFATLALVNKFHKDFYADRSLYRAFLDVEMPAVEVLRAMESRGMGINCEELRGLESTLRAKSDQILDEWEFLFPGVNIASSVQVSDHFYGEGLWPTAGISKGKSGRYTVNAEAMRAAHALCKEGSMGRLGASLRLDYQYISKNLNTYTHKLVDQATQYADSRIRCSFLQHGTRTGRLSCSGPNLQNIPARSEMGKRIRECFVAPEGRTLVVADYSQIELRVLAHLAKEGRLADAYRRNEDIHQQTADLVGCSRQQAKTINFATVYGAAAKKLGQQLGVSKYEAQKFLDGYNEAYPEVARLRKDILKDAYSTGHVRTLGGRIRHVPKLTEASRRNPDTEPFEDKLDRWHGERIAFNTPVQGGAADIVKAAMIGFHSVCDESTFMIGQVHDEIIVECDEQDAEEVAAELKSTMESVVNLGVPLVAEPSIAKSWGDAK